MPTTPPEALRPRPTDVHATIDGRPVALIDWQCDSAADWGYRTMTGKVPASVTWAEQEAPVQLWLSDGTELWAGRISLEPQLDRGMRSIRAEGYAGDIAAATTRMFYRIDGGDEWVDAESDPHGYSSIEKFDLRNGPGMLRWALGDNGGMAMVSGNQADFVLWVEGAIITRYALTVETSTSFANMELRSRDATGPDGTRGAVTSHSLAIGSPTAYAANTNGTGDLLSLGPNVTSNFTASARQRVKVTNLKVYGRTIDDAFSASQVVADVGADAGFNTDLVRSNTLAVLPLDWTDDHTSLLSYMSELMSWHWEALGPDDDGLPILAYGPWEGTFTGYMADGLEVSRRPASGDGTPPRPHNQRARGSRPIPHPIRGPHPIGGAEPTSRPRFQNKKRHNKVEVPYLSISGVRRSVIVTADPDPFPGRSVIHTTPMLEHRHSSSDLPTLVATNQVAYWSTKRVGGRVKVGRLTNEVGRVVSGYKVKPGNLLNIADRPDLEPQRIAAVSYRPGNDVTVELNDDFNVVRLLAQVQHEQRHHSRRRRHSPTSGPVR